MKNKTQVKQEQELVKVFEPEEVILEVEISEEKSLRGKLIQLANEIKEKYYELSLLLTDVYHSKIYEAWGFKNIKEYFEEELGISYRSGMYHVQMGDMIKKFNLTKEAIRGLGWSKFKEISKLTDKVAPEEVIEVIEQSKTLPVKEVENLVKKKTEAKTEERTILSFTLLKEQAEVVEKAIAIASELLNIPVGENRGRCLEYICLEFQASYNPELTEVIKKLMTPEVKKAEYKERADKGKKKSKK